MDQFLSRDTLDLYLKERDRYKKEQRNKFFKEKHKTDKYMKQVNQRLEEKHEKMMTQMAMEPKVQLEHYETVESFEKNKDDPNKYPDLSTFKVDVVEDEKLKK